MRRKAIPLTRARVRELLTLVQVAWLLVWRGLAPHSRLSATTGSTLIARRAGTYTATVVTRPKSTATATNVVVASVDLTLLPPARESNAEVVARIAADPGLRLMVEQHLAVGRLLPAVAEDLGPDEVVL